MKTSSTNMHLWVQTNRKEMTKDLFREKTGMDFDDFSSTYKKECLKTWKSYLEEKPKKGSTIAREREKHLLRVIDVWRTRYYNLKRTIITSPTKEELLELEKGSMKDSYDGCPCGMNGPCCSNPNITSGDHECTEACEDVCEDSYELVCTNCGSSCYHEL